MTGDQIAADTTSEASDVTLTPLVTAAEAYPALERLFLNARDELNGSFRIFDPATKLRSDEGRAVGETWFDLICHTLTRGVKIDLTISDFDPVFGHDLHQRTWTTMRQLACVREICTTSNLTVRAAMHPAGVGAFKRGLFWPIFYRRLKRHMADLDAMPEALRRFTLSVSPGLARILDKHGPWRISPAQYPATHHQKLVVADRKTLFIGGLDLNERRYDDPHHRRPGAQTWHDVSVLTTGPHVKDARDHLIRFRKSDAQPLPMQKHPKITFLRTLSENGHRGAFNLSPHTRLAEIEAAHLDLFARAERLIYLETQYFRSPRIARHLARAARRNPKLSLILILPAAPDDVAFEHSGSMDARFGEYLQARAIRKVLKAFGPRAFIGMSVRPVPRQAEDRSAACGAELVYIHSKIAIADDRMGIVSSANLNGRSMRWDTEAGLQIDDKDLVSNLRDRLFRHWLPDDTEDPRLFDPATAASAWAELAKNNRASPPRQRKGFIVPYDIRAAENFGRDVPFVPPEMV